MTYDAMLAVSLGLEQANTRLSWDYGEYYDTGEHFTRWHAHHQRGWYFHFVEKNYLAAKQDFYLCGRLDEALMPLQHNPAIINRSPGEHVYFSDALDGYFHWTDALLSDSYDLAQRRTRLTYSKREEYIFKDIYPLVVLNVALEHLLLDELGEASSILFQVEKSRKAKRFVYDVQFIHSFIQGDKDGMVKAIEGVASVKVHKSRQKVSNAIGPWENVLLSMSGITYTKLAWMHGYELEIKNPLVSVANELYPARPLAHYEEIYDFLKTKPEQ